MKTASRIAALVVGLFVVPISLAQAATIHVFAASSLTEAFQDIGALYTQQNPGDVVEFNFAGSQLLKTQIEEGAPADLFASADHVQMDALKAENLAAGDVVFARNRLVVVTPADKPKVRRLGDLARPGIRLVVANANVPVGRYTTQLLGKMTKAGLYGDDFQRRVTANVVSQETNVRAVLAKVSLGEADAGVVYVTDARTVADAVTVIEIPDRMNIVAEYPIAVLSRSEATEAAGRFMALVMSNAGREILAKRGFETVR
jgi:molybdate transport system substrate-binding protein